MKLTEEQKKANREAKKAARVLATETARVEEEKNQKPVKSITISIEWKKSRRWGSNPVAEGRIEYADGTWGHTATARASGCGYDKESAVIAQIFNWCLKYKLWALSDEAMNGERGGGRVPYGINRYNNGRCFASGVGTSCYYDICKYLGGTFVHTASGKAFDVYTATF